LNYFLKTLTIALAPSLAAGQVLSTSTASSYIDLGAYSLRHADAFAFSSNQASLAQLHQAVAAVYAERRFNLGELAHNDGVIGLPTRSGNFGIRVTSIGSSAYNQTVLGLAYARNLGSKIDIGVQFNYDALRIPGYGNASAISFEAGTLLHLSEKLHTGFHVNNPVGGKLGHNEKLPSVYALGIGYDASENFFFGAEIIKEEGQPINVNAGLEYKFVPQLFASAGISAATASAWFGVGVLMRSFRMDVRSSYHPQLGFSPGLLVVFTFNKTSEQR